MKRVIITGCTGFIGRSLINELESEKLTIIGYSSKDGNITEKNTWLKMPKANYLIHLAAMTFIPKSWDDPKKFIDTNTIALLNAIEYCKKYKSKLIYLSTFVYGSKNIPIDENSELNPQNPYALSKLLGENICSFYKKVDNLDVIILRPFNIFGNGQNNLFLIPSLISQIKNEEKITVMDINPKRDYLYIKDLVDAIKKSLFYKGNSYIFNIGSGLSYSVIEVIEIIQKICETNLDIECTNKVRRMELDDTVANIELAKRELKWEPKYSLPKALKEMLKVNS